MPRTFSRKFEGGSSESYPRGRRLRPVPQAADGKQGGNPVLIGIGRVPNHSRCYRTPRGQHDRKARAALYARAQSGPLERKHVRNLEV